MEYFLQTPLWADFLRAQGGTVIERSGPGWRYLASVERNAAGKILYSPYGPVADSVDALSLALASLAEEAAAIKAICVRVEPVAAGFPPSDAAPVLKGLGLRRAPSDQQPELSWVIDLSVDEKLLLGAMRSSNRNLHRNIHKKGVTFRATRDPAELPVLLGFLRQTAARNGFTPQEDVYLRRAAETLMPAGAATLYLAELDGTPIAAALSYDTSDTRVYAHAAMDDAHRKLGAGVPLLVTLILEAKREGLRWVDLWGIAPDDEPEHKWAGFTAFKKSFGGEEVVRTGTWDLPVDRLRYAAYQGSRHARGLLRTARKTLLAAGRSLGTTGTSLLAQGKDLVSHAGRSSRG